MSRIQYHLHAHNGGIGLEHTDQPHERPGETAPPYGACGMNNIAPADTGRYTLPTVVGGLLSGAQPVQFMDSINSGNELLGNRGFLNLVDKLQGGRRQADTRVIAQRGLAGPGRPLTHLAQLQQAFGHHDIRAMREHTGPGAGSALAALGAEGYACDGRMALAGPPDLYVQAHEAAHGVQQAAHGAGLPLAGSPGDCHEREADAVAEAVVRGESAQPLLDSMAGHPTQVIPGSGNGAVQMKWPDRNLEDLTMEEFEAAIQEMTDAELDEAWEELTLLFEIAELEEEEVKSKSQVRAKKGKKEPYKPTQEEIQARRAAKKAQAGGGQSGAGKKQKQKQPQNAQARKGGSKKGGKVTLDQTPGLQDMFLTRAINHLIMGELHELDPLLGEEGCQIRTPFILDMCRLVQARMPGNAVELVHEYRAKADNEQSRVLGELQSLETRRKESDPEYGRSVIHFIDADVPKLKESIEAKSGEYEAMFVNLVSAIKENDPGYEDYLSRACSEASIYWGDVLDPFGISMLTDKHPIFPDTMLSRRKVEQSRLSKKYLARAAARLVETGGGTVGREEKELGYDKKKAMQIEPQFLVAQTNKEDILSMLLHAVQMHSGSASVKGGRLEMGPCWESARLALTYALKQAYPLLVNLRRLIVSGEGQERQYSTNISRTIFYGPSAEGYKYLPDPSESQRSQGALLFQGFSMLKEGDTALSGSTLPAAPWIFEQDPTKFLAGFTKCDIANLLLLGGAGTHPPLNTGAPGCSAYGLPGGPEGVYKFDNDPGGVRYAEAIHDRVLSDLGQTDMTEAGRQFLMPKSDAELQEEEEEYLKNKAVMAAGGKEAEPYIRTVFKLTDKALRLVFPDECPISLAGTGAKFNIKEEYQLLRLLSVAAGMKDVLYSKENRHEGTAQRVAARTIPFAIVHILASNFAHEDALSREFAAVPRTRGIIEKLEELRRK